MREHVTRGIICVDSDLGIPYRVGRLVYRLWEDESFSYCLTPFWDVIDLLAPPLFQGIPGFDLDARKETYVRENLVPAFVADRAPAPNREGLWELLDDCSMDYLDQLEWLIRTDTRYIGDALYVIRDDGDLRVVDVGHLVDHAANTEMAMRGLIVALGRGDRLIQDGGELDGVQKRALHGALVRLYGKGKRRREERRLEGIERAAQKGAYRGRKRKPVDELVLRDALDRHDRGELTAAQAAAIVGTSVATFYRRAAELRVETAPVG